MPLFKPLTFVRLFKSLMKLCSRTAEHESAFTMLCCTEVGDDGCSYWRHAWWPMHSCCSAWGWQNVVSSTQHLLVGTTTPCHQKVQCCCAEKSHRVNCMAWLLTICQAALLNTHTKACGSMTTRRQIATYSVHTRSVHANMQGNSDNAFFLFVRTLNKRTVLM